MKSRSYCFTINNPTFDDITLFLDNDDWTYLIVGIEKGKKGTEHLQGYVYFDSQRHFKSVKDNYFPRSHLEIARGNFNQNIDYCTKDGEWFEFGDRPHQGAASWDKIEAVMADPRSNFHLYQQYHKTYTEYMRLELQEYRKITPRQLIVEHWLDPEVFPPDKTFLFDYESNIDTYQGESIAVCTVPKHISDLFIHQWYIGYFPRIKRGYEVIHFNPEKIIFLTQGDDDLLRKLRNKNLHYI